MPHGLPEPLAAEIRMDRLRSKICSMIPNKQAAMPERTLLSDSERLLRLETAQQWFEREVRDAVQRIEIAVREGQERLGGNLRDLQSELRGVVARFEVALEKDAEMTNERIRKLEQAGDQQRGIGIALATGAGFLGGGSVFAALKGLFGLH